MIKKVESWRDKNERDRIEREKEREKIKREEEIELYFKEHQLK